MTMKPNKLSFSYIKSNAPIILSFIFMLAVVWWVDGNFLDGLYISLFFLCGFTFHYNVIYVYKTLKRNRFSIKKASIQINWYYELISTTLIVLCFCFFMPYPLQIAGLIMSLCLIVGLFLLDLIMSKLR
jgi:hypothetical protein